MHSFTVIHESRNLKQARQICQHVDLLRLRARYSLIGTQVTLALMETFVNPYLFLTNIFPFCRFHFGHLQHFSYFFVGFCVNFCHF